MIYAFGALIRGGFPDSGIILTYFFMTTSENEKVTPQLQQAIE